MSTLDTQSLMAMLPQPVITTTAPPPTMAPVPAPTLPPYTPPPTQLPVNIQLTVDREKNDATQRERGGGYYRPPPYYGPGYGTQYPAGIPYLPGGLGGINTYPGAAADASIKIGAINSSLSQGNMNWGGNQALGAVFPVPTTETPVPTAAPLPPPAPVQMAPVVIETPPPSKGINWMNIALLVCVAIALGVAFYILYTKYIKKKRNNTNNTKASTNNTNTNATTATNNTKSNTRRSKNATATNANAGLDDEFGADDFGDFEDAPTSTTR